MSTGRRYPFPILICCLAFFFLTACGDHPAPALPQMSAPVSAEPATTPSSIQPYTFGTPLEEGEAVEDDSFFDGAVFLGDSRTEGLQLFSGLTHGDFFWARGMSVFRADSDDFQVFEIDGQRFTLMGALRVKSYHAVYLMMGINELGYSAAQYERGLSALIDQMIDAQPNAVIYLQILPPVNDASARAHGLAYYINNDQVNSFNEAITRVAAEKQVVLLDTAEVYRDETGQLPEALASDGVHFTYDGYTAWADYLRCHVMDPERYFYSRGDGSGSNAGAPA